MLGSTQIFHHNKQITCVGHLLSSGLVESHHWWLYFYYHYMSHTLLHTSGENLDDSKLDSVIATMSLKNEICTYNVWGGE